MAIRAEIKCISKTNRLNAYERIHSVGGINSDGDRWKISQEQAVIGIDSGTYSFYVRHVNCTLEVVVATNRFGNRYLKTIADSEQPNNLLELPECL